jgi:primosomal replication protein N
MTDIIETDSPVTPWQGSVKFDGAPFPQILERCEQIADQVARISQNTTGAQASGQTTATEQSIIAAGVAVGLEGYIAKFSEEFGMMMSLTMQIIAQDFEAYKERYGNEEQVSSNLVGQE